MMRRHLYLLVLCTLISFISIAGTLKGKVTDDKGQSLPYATIFLQGTTIGVSAGADGNYALDIAPGTYKVVCGYVGFKQSSFNLSITGSETIVHNFTLHEESMQMNEVVVHANTEDPAYPI